MLNSLQNKTFMHGIDKYYFKPMCEIMTASLEKGLVDSCVCAITRQPCVPAAGIRSNLEQVKRVLLCFVLWLAQ